MDAVLSKNSGDIGAVQRARIIQRVLVDGWSLAQASAVFDLPERRIARWVHDYKRRGMASLREAEPAERAIQRWLGLVAGAFARGYVGVRRGFGLVEPSSCVVLRHTGDKPDRGRADLA
jgi:Homeodomain-like domain-containing protein